MGLSGLRFALNSGMVENLLVAPDLTRVAPRAPQRQLGGYAVAARVLDKCRAEMAGKSGEYNFNCPLDRLFFVASGLRAENFSAMAATGADDATAADWIRRESKANIIRRSIWNVLATIHP